MTTDGNKTYYFLGIGGIGMSALARYFKSLGYDVSGYDRTCTPLTQQLESEGIKIHYAADTSLIPNNLDMVVYTPAIPADNEEFVYLQQQDVPMKKRAVVLGEIANGKKCVAVAGSHGKTTTSGLIAHILDSSRVGCSAFLGGIAKNFDSNLVINHNSEFVVVEADEYDRSFLQLNPYYSVITSADADHLDIYGTHKNLLDTFAIYANKTNPEGGLILKSSLEFEIDEKISLSRYSFDDLEADYYTWNVRNYKGNYYFDFHTPEKVYYDIEMCGSPLYNIENAVAAMAVALKCGVTEEEMRSAVKSFQGIKRRFDYRIKTPDFVFIDDYAHHPHEIESCIQSVKTLYPDKRVVGVFQPHLYSRTANFADDFAKALMPLDEIVLLDIYPAREKPIPGVSSHLILHKINKMNKYLCSKDDLCDILVALYPEVLVTMGAGDIDALLTKIQKTFEEQFDIK
ncbi:MAG: UDP-N-acetylmuramate--L-alanine ligase [Bacteroidales bacterium]|nr:UDP-N-acetylmuramate--L-alanine ligase [Bacteroidales bacterium]